MAQGLQPKELKRQQTLSCNLPIRKKLQARKPFTGSLSVLCVQLMFAHSPSLQFTQIEPYKSHPVQSVNISPSDEHTREISFSISALQNFSGPKHQVVVLHFGINHKKQYTFKTEISCEKTLKIKRVLYECFTKSILLNSWYCQNSG